MHNKNRTANDQKPFLDGLYDCFSLCLPRTRKRWPVRAFSTHLFHHLSYNNTKNLMTKLERMDKNTEVVKCCRNHLDVFAKIGMFASDTSSTNNAPYCRWRGLIDNNKKWKIKLNTEHAKPGSSATQHNYYFANVGTLKKCLLRVHYLGDIMQM